MSSQILDWPADERDMITGDQGLKTRWIQGSHPSSSSLYPPTPCLLLMQRVVALVLRKFEPSVQVGRGLLQESRR